MNAQNVVEFYHSIPQRFYYNGKKHEVWGIIVHSKELVSGRERPYFVVMTPHMETFKIWYDNISSSWLVEETP